MAVAWLHDLVEDQPTYADCLAHFPPKIARAVYLLTKDQAEPAELYFGRIKADPLALRVKLADIADNMSEQRMGRLDPETQARLRTKYAQGLAILTHPERETGTRWRAGVFGVRTPSPANGSGPPIGTTVRLMPMSCGMLSA